MGSPKSCSFHSSINPELLEIKGLRPEVFESESECPKVLKIKLTIWLKFMIYLLVISIIFSFCAFITPRWVEQGSSATFWRGNILTCGGCKGYWNNMSYKSIIAESCDDMKGYCFTFQKLYYAGVAAVLIEAFFYILSGVWILLVVFTLKGRRDNKKLVRIVVIFTPLFHMLSVLAWFGISQAGFSKNCYKSSTNSQESQYLCATHGPILLIISNFLTAFSAAVYLIIYSQLYLKQESSVSPY